MADTNLLVLAREYKKLREEVKKVLSMPKGDKGDQGEKGEKGDTGDAGPQGFPGRDGKDGINGYDGKDGLNGNDGKDGKDGLDGVGVQNAYIDFDNSLVIVLTDGREVNAGYLSQETKDNVIATFKQGAATINELLPTQTGNADKVLTTDGSNVYWATAAGGGSPFTTPVVINVNSTDPALKLTQTGTGPALLAEDSASPDATPTVIDQFGNLILGKDSRSRSVNSKVEIHSTSESSVNPSIGLYNSSNTSTDESNITFRHDKSGLQDPGDHIGRINFLTVSGGGSINAKADAFASGVDMFYAAQSHQFTGPITAGTWNGSAIGVAYGGTGTSTPSLVAGTNVTITGTWPNQTISASGGGGGGTLTINNRTAAYTVVAGDLGRIINCTSGTFTVSLTAAATLGAGFNCWIWNTSTNTANVITIDPNGAETIDRRATRILRCGEGCQIICDGTNWSTGDKKVMQLYAENMDLLNGTSPSAVGDRSVAIGTGTSANGFASAAIGQNNTAGGTADFVAGTASSSGGAGYAIAINGNANSGNSTAIGHNSGLNRAQTATGSGAMALGGSYASGTDSFAAAIANNTSSFGARGTNSIAIGLQANASATNSIAIGARSSATSFGTISICHSYGNYGNANTATGAVTIGDGNSASQGLSWAVNYSANSAVFGKYAYANGSFSDGNAEGSAQYAYVVLRRATTDATATLLTSNSSSGSTLNQVILRNNTAFVFTGTVVARQQASGGTQSAAWRVEGLIRREGTAASTTLVASTVTAISNVPGWTLALSADTTSGGLAVTFTGAAATNIRAVATIQTSEVTF